MIGIILIGSYFGKSDFIYQVCCTGRQLNMKEVLEKGFTNQDEIDQHKLSSYSYVWYEISSGDTINILNYSDEEDFEYEFKIPDTALPDAPLSMSEAYGMHLHKYLLRYCEYKIIDDGLGDE